jgi:hypothetical protein
MNIFLGPSFKIPYVSADGFQIVGSVSVKKINMMFLLASMKSLTHFNPSCNPFEEACHGFQIAACGSNSCSGSLCVPEKCSESQLINLHNCTMYTAGENRSVTDKKKSDGNSNAAFGTSFRIRKCLNEASRK